MGESRRPALGAWRPWVWWARTLTVLLSGVPFHCGRETAPSLHPAGCRRSGRCGMRRPGAGAAQRPRRTSAGGVGGGPAAGRQAWDRAAPAGPRGSAPRRAFGATQTRPGGQRPPCQKHPRVTVAPPRDEPGAGSAPQLPLPGTPRDSRSPRCRLRGTNNSGRFQVYSGQGDSALTLGHDLNGSKCYSHTQTVPAPCWG